MTVLYNVDLMKTDARAQGLTDTALALKAAVAQWTVSRIFAGGRPSPTTAGKLAKALGHDLQRYVVAERQAAHR